MSFLYFLASASGLRRPDGVDAFWLPQSPSALEVSKAMLRTPLFTFHLA